MGCFFEEKHNGSLIDLSRVVDSCIKEVAFLHACNVCPRLLQKKLDSHRMNYVFCTFSRLPKGDSRRILTQQLCTFIPIR